MAACRFFLSGREHPPTALIELRADSLPAFAHRLRVDHADPHTADHSARNPAPPSHIAPWRPAENRFTCCGGCPWPGSQLFLPDFGLAGLSGLANPSKLPER